MCNLDVLVISFLDVYFEEYSGKEHPNDLTDRELFNLVKESGYHLGIKSFEGYFNDADVSTATDYIRFVEVYYQPKLTEKEWQQYNLETHEVFSSFTKAQKEFPNHDILEFVGEEIEEHSYVN